MKAWDGGLLQHPKRKRHDECTSHGEEPPEEPRLTEPEGHQLNGHLDLTKLHSLSLLLSQLKLRLPEVDDYTLNEFAQTQLKKNTLSLARVRLANAHAQSGDSDAFEDIRSLEITVPLTRDTWFEWVRQLKRIVSLINYAEDLLFTQEDFEYTPFLRKLDDKLYTTISYFIQKTGTRRDEIDYCLMSNDAWHSGRSFLRDLESQLRPAGFWEEVLTLYKLNRVALTYTNVDATIRDIERYARHLADIGSPIPETQKCAILLCTTRGQEWFDGAWTSLMNTKSCKNWESVHRVLHFAQSAQQTSHP
ncbi:hypothetical protein BCV69DRAFT_301896 [Microstroma glucosiphilum]|uniref:Uncharacterized protein n=1 Tax=Pseudomicrostroma glucosiphilum TaxID=1684307 RepID=A0A316TWX9_9BASI|nr:hypothetical protein BCV69DRAFT_301896 [Pseudomicrostroma glucosiphilum]PWN17710.1 hypothetical protein BCV69DRAFT_301896 [Pseudomicrostroma glucosiphilum]